MNNKNKKIQRDSSTTLRMTERGKGFTLIELMLVVSITSMIVVTITGLFFRSIRGGAKTDVLVKVEENAQYTLGLMERFIKNAKSIESLCPGASSSLTLMNWDGGSSTFSLSNGSIASNGAAISEEAIIVENLSFECIRISGIPDQIMISFDARTTGESGTSSMQSFATTVNLRNY